MRLLFFLNAYSGSRKLTFVLLLLLEKVLPDSLRKLYFNKSLIESRSILGFIYDREGVVTSTLETMQIRFRFRERFVIFKLRWHSSDFVVFEQIFIREEYQFATQQHFDSPCIVDAGANIGCTTVYFKAIYPFAKILAVEADPDNYSALQENLRLNNLHDVQCAAVALWFENGTVAISRNFKDGRDWSAHVDTQGQTPVTSRTLGTLLESYGINSIDILKMDIEGSERPIFIKDETINESLVKIRCIAIEVHTEDDLIEKRLRGLGFRMFKKGETLFAQKD